MLRNTLTEIANQLSNYILGRYRRKNSEGKPIDKNHLLYILRHDTPTWNAWRRQNPEVRPDLSHLELNTLLTKSTLYSEKSIFRHFQKMDFQGIDLHDADLRQSKIGKVNLSHVNLVDADLSGAEIRWSQLKGADLRGADLRHTQFLKSDLSGARIEGAILGNTHLGYTNLSDVHGLDQVEHQEMSHIDQFSIINSMPLPITFLNLCGIPRHTIEMAELYAKSRPYRTCFISYSRRDETFVEHLREVMTRAGVPSWFAPQDMRHEEFQFDERELERDLYTYVDSAECVLLIISPNILPSRWVGKELLRARGRTPRIIPILIESMPIPGSPEWNTLLVEMDEREKFFDMNSDMYSQELSQLLNGRYLDFRNWQESSIFAHSFPHILSLLSLRV